MVVGDDQVSRPGDRQADHLADHRAVWRSSVAFRDRCCQRASSQGGWSRLRSGRCRRRERVAQGPGICPHTPYRGFRPQVADRSGTCGVPTVGEPLAHRDKRGSPRLWSSTNTRVTAGKPSSIVNRSHWPSLDARAQPTQLRVTRTPALGIYRSDKLVTGEIRCAFSASARRGWRSTTIWSRSRHGRADHPQRILPCTSARDGQGYPAA
jgi:hypothetical protein